ncbi:MAG: arginine repressor [Clostridia bacterium]|nr:arginine repressor [Clostridia bacterium]
MTREQRQKKLLEIIESNDIETQQELLEALLSSGFKATQATVSRDIKELGLVKESNGKSKSRYVKPLYPKLVKLRTIFHTSVLHIDYVNNLIILKTISGGANAASALVDEIAIPDIVGTIAGDDTFLVICRDEKKVPDIINQFRQLID